MAKLFIFVFAIFMLAMTMSTVEYVKKNQNKRFVTDTWSNYGSIAK